MYKPSIVFSRLRILIIENHALTRRLLGEILRGFGAQQVSFTRDVPGAMDLIYSEDFDIVILDFFLGDLDGADFAKHIRYDENCRNRQVPILLITGQPDHKKVMRVMEAGINTMLAKPIAPNDLYKRIHALLSNPKLFVISNDYVGPIRTTKSSTATDGQRSANMNISAHAKKPREREAHVYEDGILI
jgi:two-component system chemotaxis response regulator CheY